MRKQLQALPEEQEPERTVPRSPGPGLTEEQKEATIQKWAEWILKQQENAAKPKPMRNRTHNGQA